MPSAPSQQPPHRHPSRSGGAWVAVGLAILVVGVLLARQWVWAKPAPHLVPVATFDWSPNNVSVSRNEAEPTKPAEQPATAADAGDALAANDAVATDDETADDTQNETEESNDGAAPEAPGDDSPFSQRVPAPSLDVGGEWFNTAGPIDIKDLRGKFVILDFWTYCCINCMHILPELKKLEHAYPNELVVIGVHSAKFDTEKDAQNIREAVLRYEIEHPVVVDSNHLIWMNYFVNSWPSLRMIDPEGNLVAGHGGEITFEMLDGFLKKVIPYYRERKLLDETPLQFNLERFRADSTPLRFPGKVLADEKHNRLFIADSNHNRLVITTLDGTLIDIVGSGAIGTKDGDFTTVEFNKPQGMVLHDGNTLYVADTENHLLRKVDLSSKQVTTIAGTGVQSRSPWPGVDERGPVRGSPLPNRFVGKPAETALNSPWDLWIHGKNLYIAMAGPHQIWRMPLDESEIGPYAGNGREDIVDGKMLPREPFDLGFASFAQPSGLSSDGKRLFVADSEGSSIRSVPFTRGDVTTLIGTADLPDARLFTFGDVDGSAKLARLQHALGVSFYRDHLYIADTYNNKIKVFDLAKKSIKTLAGTGKPGREDEPAQFDEPAGISAAAGRLYVADTNNHRIRVIDLDHDGRTSTLEIAGLTPPAPVKEKGADALPKDVVEVDSPPQALKPDGGSVTFNVNLQLPSGFKINSLAPMSYRVSLEEASGPIDRAVTQDAVRVDPPTATFSVKLPTAKATGKDTAHILVRYFYCREGAEGLCKTGSVRFNVPIELSEQGAESAGNLEYTVGE